MRIGIVGGGQLARMLILAGYPLGLQFTVLDPAADACAGQIAELIQGNYDDPDKLSQLIERIDVATFDFENVPVAAAHVLAQQVLVFPPPTALETAQDRYTEKVLFQELGIPTPPFIAVETLDELREALARITLPAILKTRRLGYDGKGQRLLRHPDEIEAAWTALRGVPLILEGYVPFQREVSILGLRGRHGETAFYPLVENRHRDGILSLSLAPCADAELERQVRHYATRILEKLDYVGLLAIEFFVQDGRLLANEMAPRVHNSGHWTIEGAETSQFENHLRALLRWPLGSTDAVGCSAMLNFIGALPDRHAMLSIPGVHLHDYGKAPQPGRKVGHATVRATDPAILKKRLAELLRVAGIESGERDIPWV